MSSCLICLVCSCSLNFFSLALTLETNYAFLYLSSEQRKVTRRVISIHIVIIIYDLDLKLVVKIRILLLITHIIMSNKDKDSREQKPFVFTWTNKDQYLQGTKKLGKAVAEASQALEEQKAIELLNSMESKSKASLLYLNRTTKQMTLLSQPILTSGMNDQIEQWSYNQFLRNVRYSFDYGVGLKYLYGKRGVQGKISLEKTFKNGLAYNLSYSKKIYQRITNHLAADTDKVRLQLKIPFKWSQHPIKLQLSRHNRSNFLSFYKKDNEKDLKITERLSKQCLKNSNLYTLGLQSSILNIRVLNELGYDFGNSYLFHRHSISSKFNFNITDDIKFSLMLQGFTIKGNNLLQNDLAHLSKRSWISKVSNYLTAQVFLTFQNYPITSIISLNPYLYGQIWSVFKLSQANKVNTDLYGQYGIGVKNNADNLNIHFSLFQVSGKRVQGGFSSIKFSFD